MIEEILVTKLRPPLVGTSSLDRHPRLLTRLNEGAPGKLTAVLLLNGQLAIWHIFYRRRLTPVLAPCKVQPSAEP